MEVEEQIEEAIADTAHGYAALLLAADRAQRAVNVLRKCIASGQPANGDLWALYFTATHQAGGNQALDAVYQAHRRAREAATLEPYDTGDDDELYQLFRELLEKTG